MTKHRRPEDPHDEERDIDAQLGDEVVAEPRDAYLLEKLLADAERVAVDWKQKHDDVQDRHARSLAEADNSRKRMLRDVETSRQYAVERIAKDLLQVTDNLRRALDGVPADRADDPLVAGVKLVEGQLEGILASHGVKPIEAFGAPFDPNLHEAIAADERDDVAPNVVIAELVRGWKIHDRLLRPAMVRVSKRPSGAAQES